METKFCRKCKTDKTIDMFCKNKNNSDGLSNQCKDCDKEYRDSHREDRKEYDKNYRKEHKKELAKYQKQYEKDNEIEIRKRKKEYYENNKDHILISSKKRYEENINIISKKHKEYRDSHKEESSEYGKQYRKDNKEKVNEYQKNYNKQKRETKVEAKVIHRLRNNFLQAMNIYSSTGKIQESKKYGIDYGTIIEKLGLPPENMIDPQADHILPVSAFNHNDPIEIIACWSPENFQWLSAEENLKKSNKYDKEEFKKYLSKFKK